MSMQRQPPATTGLPGLDTVLSGIEPGDNIVWAVDAIADYQEFVSPYVAAAQADLLGLPRSSAPGMP